MADRALGLAPPADAQLAEPAARVPYEGDDPDGYMTAAEVAELIERFAQSARAPVRTRTDVTSVRRGDAGYRVATEHGEIQARWWCSRPAPAICLRAAASRTPCLRTSSRSRRRLPQPAQLEHGGVLVVGASATGMQLAGEISRSGRPVTLAVGEHIRAPRTYRGRDIQWWMDASGVLDQRYDEVEDITRARRLPSPQLVGTPERATLDLNALRARRPAGRSLGVGPRRLACFPAACGTSARSRT